MRTKGKQLVITKRVINRRM